MCIKLKRIIFFSHNFSWLKNITISCRWKKRLVILEMVWREKRASGSLLDNIATKRESFFIIFYHRDHLNYRNTETFWYCLVIFALSHACQPKDLVNLNPWLSLVETSTLGHLLFSYGACWDCCTPMSQCRQLCTAWFRVFPPLTLAQEKLQISAKVVHFELKPLGAGAEH